MYNMYMTINKRKSSVYSTSTLLPAGPHKSRSLFRASRHYPCLSSYGSHISQHPLEFSNNCTVVGCGSSS